jgi:hypothetical protein
LAALTALIRGAIGLIAIVLNRFWPVALAALILLGFGVTH